MKWLLSLLIVMIIFTSFTQPKLWFCYAEKSGQNYMLIVRAVNENEAEKTFANWLNNQPKDQVQKKKQEATGAEYFIRPIERLILNETK